MGNFPDIPKSISDYLYEEEGNITRNKLLMVGSLSVVLSVLFALEADAGHGSHKSHKSHTSHSSGLHTQTDNSHSSHSSSSHTNAKIPNTSNSFPKVLTPQKSANSLLPESVDLIKDLSIPNFPDTATPAFSSSILNTPAEMTQE